MVVHNKKIAIVGAGPGGLTLARLLQLAGADVTVYERDLNKEVRVQGSTLDLHKDSGLKALEKAGLTEAFKASYRPGADKIRIADQNAHIHFDEHGTKPNEDFGKEHFRPEIDRGPLRKLLLDSLQQNTVVWNSKFRSIKQCGHGWSLFFENGHSAYADLVVGADGAHSKIRTAVTPIKPVYSGITMIEGTIYNSEESCPSIHRLLKGGKIFALGTERTLIISAKEGGALSFYTGCKTDECWARNSGIDFTRKEDLLEWFKAEFTAWDTLWQELFDNDKTTFIPRPQYYLPLDQSWEAQSNITLIGDAAHVMPPFAGEGVNMALWDALTLSECLTGTDFKDTRSAIENYEYLMRKKAAEITQMTLEQTASLHAENALQNMLDQFGT